MRKGIVFVVAVSIALAIGTAGHVAGRHADTGSLNVTGTLTMGTGGALKSGATDYSTGTGYFMDYNGGTPRFRIGNPAGNKLTWDGSTLAITGTVTATSGTIGGWSIGSHALTAGNMSLSDSGALTAGNLEITSSHLVIGDSMQGIKFGDDYDATIYMGGTAGDIYETSDVGWSIGTGLLHLTGTDSITLQTPDLIIDSQHGLHDTDLCASNDGVFSLDVRRGIIVGASCVISDRPTMQQQVDALREEILRLREELATLRAERPQAARYEAK